MNKEKVKQGCAGLSVLFLLLVILIIVIAPEPEKPVVAQAGPTPKALKAAKPAISDEAQELLTVIHQASSATAGCTFAIDETIDLLATASESPGNLMKAYSKAHMGEPDCKDAVDDLGQIERLKLANPVMTSNLDFALDECARAAKLRAEALKTVKVALDGDYSFATAQKFKDAQQEARTTHNLCMGELKQIGLESGLTPDSLSFLDV